MVFIIKRRQKKEMKTIMQKYEIIFVFRIK